MHTDSHTAEIPTGLLDAIRTFPSQREVEHCGTQFSVSSLEIYAECPQCGSQIKVRSFAAHPELEDLFDVVLEWMLDPKAREVASRRQQTIAEDAGE